MNRPLKPLTLTRFPSTGSRRMQQELPQVPTLKIPILNSESDNEAFLYLLSQFAHARRVLGWNNGDVV